MEDELMELVSQLAAWVGDVAPEVWAVMLRQAMVQGWQNLFGAIVGLLAIVGGVVAGVRGWKSDDEDIAGCLGVLAFILLVSGFIAFIACGLTAIGHLANPAYYALRNIRGIFR